MSWTIRNTAPSASNLWYVKTTYGGYNRAILINSATGECIPNCVGYSFGRFMEGAGVTSCNLSVGDASTFYGRNDGYVRGQVPQVGAVMCWGGGYYGGAGHVCIVEQVIDSNTVITSESNYGGTRWYSKTRYRGADGRWGMSDLFWFQGFIYNPYASGGVYPPPDPDPHPQPKPSGFPEILTYLLPVVIFKKRKKGGIR